MHALIVRSRWYSEYEIGLYQNKYVWIHLSLPEMVYTGAATIPMDSSSCFWIDGLIYRKWRVPKVICST